MPIVAGPTAWLNRTVVRRNGTFETLGNEILEIESKGSILIKAKREGSNVKVGRSIYVIKAVNTNSLTITWFDVSMDVLDFREDVYVSSLSVISYRTNPLRLIVPPYEQEIVLESVSVLSELSESNFYFSESSSSGSGSGSSSSVDSVEGMMSSFVFDREELGVLLASAVLIVGGMLIVQVFCSRSWMK
eukprot:gene10017-12867_t